MANESFLALSESIRNLNFLKDLSDLETDQKEEFEEYLKDLASRQADKFDRVIAMIKRCDTYINALDDELNEVKTALDSWKKQKQRLTDLIKYCYQQELIGNKPTGTQYQAVIRATKPRLVDNIGNWSDEEIKQYAIQKTVTYTRLRDNSVLTSEVENVPDKDELRQALARDESSAPLSAQLIPGYSLTYSRRTRLTQS
jgi:hypothetical protein